MNKNVKLIKGVESTPLNRLNESQTANLKHPDKYVFQGVFTACSTPEHKIVNRNGRIYQKTEFLRHLGYLRDMIKENNGRLLGELDHPEGRFDVQLKEASHMITDLWFDESSNCVMGRLEVLDTPNGKILKELIDAGFPLYVSSRAAGDVNEKTKEVEIAQIFTYDVVCTPGFKEARLERLDESAMTDKTLRYINESISNVKAATKKDINVPTEYLNEKAVNKYNTTKVSDVTAPLLEADEEMKVKNFLPIQNTSGQLKEDDEPDSKSEKPENDKEEKKDGDKEKNEDKDKDKDTFEVKSLSDDEKKANRANIVSIKGIDKDGKEISNESDDDEKASKRSDIVSIKAVKDDEDKDNEKDEKSEKDSEKDENKDKEQNECDNFDDKDKTDEGCGKKKEKKDNKKTEAIKKKTDKDVADYQALIDSVTKQESVKESIIRRYPFTAFLTESNFSKFAVLRPKQKKRCAEFIEDHDVHSIEAINELWSTPLREEKKLQQNWLRLASQSDIDLYTAAPVEVQNAIEESAQYVILETQDDVDLFWQRTGLRQKNAQRMMMERKMFDFKNNMFANEEYKQNNNLGYNVDWITITESMLNND